MEHHLDCLLGHTLGGQDGTEVISTYAQQVLIVHQLKPSPSKSVGLGLVHHDWLLILFAVRLPRKVDRRLALAFEALAVPFMSHLVLVPASVADRGRQWDDPQRLDDLLLLLDDVLGGFVWLAGPAQSLLDGACPLVLLL